MKKIGVCGNFAYRKNISNGQIIKTRTVTQELIKQYGQDNVITVDTNSWKEQPLKLFVKCIYLAISSENIIIFPAHNGIKVFGPLFSVLSFLFRKKLHYSVIGGWLPEYLEKNKWLVIFLRYMDAIYVETESMKNKISRHKLNQIIVMPNFKNIKLLKSGTMNKTFEEPYKLCTFSRVKKDKGIIDAINAVAEINKKNEKKIFTLDIYGSIDPSFEKEFNSIVSNNEEFVQYKGLVDYNDTSKVLKNYIALLFPTYYEGEGFPGTIIDAFSAGVPVIATDWRYNSEIISHGITGYIYEIKINKALELKKLLEKISTNPDSVIKMKNRCLDEAKKYNAKLVMTRLYENL